MNKKQEIKDDIKALAWHVHLEVNEWRAQAIAEELTGTELDGSFIALCDRLKGLLIPPWID